MVLGKCLHWGIGPVTRQQKVTGSFCRMVQCTCWTSRPEGKSIPVIASAATEVHGEGNQGGIRKSIRYGTSNQSKCDWVGTWNIAGGNTAIALW